MESKDKLIGFGMIIAGIIFIALGVVAMMPKTTPNTDVYAEQGIDNEEVETVDLNVWNGIYKNDIGEVTLSRIDEDELGMTVVVSGESVNFVSYTLKLTSDISLTYTNSDNTENITIESSENSIKIQASSTDETSLLNNISGTYVKEAFLPIGWDGVYVNADNSVTIAEIGQNKIAVNIKKGVSVYSTEVSEVTQQKLTHETTSFGETEKITITKSTGGSIILEASTTEVDGILSGINATYKKVE